MQPITKADVLAELTQLQDPDGDHESQHQLADALLLQYINDDEIFAAYCAIKRGYA